MRVLIAIPTDGMMRACLSQWTWNFDRMGHECSIDIHVGRPIERNRKEIRKIFLDGGFDWLFQIDSDMQPPIDLLKMIDNGLDICSADIRTVKGSEIVRLGLKEISKGEYLPVPNKDGEYLIECDAVGGGCLLTSRKVMEKIDYNYMSDNVKAEDFDFSKRAKEAGFQPYMDLRFRSIHYTICGI